MLTQTEDEISRNLKEVSTGKSNTAEREKQLAGKKVLLVEDNELNMEIVTDLLEDEGLSVDTAEDGLMAVHKIEEKGIGYYDFILMDIQMPIMNGYEATREIRQLQRPGEHVPIIAVSANAFTEDIRNSIEAGMDAHIAKPIELEQLKNAIITYVK